MKRFITLLLSILVVVSACKKDAEHIPEIIPAKPTHPACKILRETTDASSVTFIYDSRGLVVERIDSIWYYSPTEINDNVYTYDSLGRLSNVKTFSGLNKSEWVNLATYTYQPDKIIKKTAVVQKGQVSESGRIYEYILNQKGKLLGTVELRYSDNNIERLDYSETETDDNDNIIIQKWFRDGKSLRIDSFYYDDKYNPEVLQPEATIIPTGLNNIKVISVMDSTRKITYSFTYPYTYNSTGYPHSIYNNATQLTYSCN